MRTASNARARVDDYLVSIKPAGGVLLSRGFLPFAGISASAELFSISASGTHAIDINIRDTVFFPLLGGNQVVF
jgi:hypothetical protein